MLLKDELSISGFKEVLLYLSDRAKNDEIVAEFEEDGEWSLAIDNINQHLSDLQRQLK